MTRFLLTSFCFFCLLSGCTVQQVPERTDPVDGSQPRVERLLQEAGSAIDRNHLTTPRDDNAYSRYRQVLALDPGNEAALEGINTITETYLSWAIEYAREGNARQARYYLGRAETVDPSHPNIEPVASLINDMEQVRIERFDIPSHVVVNRTDRYPLFEKIAARIASDKPFVTIRAPDDAAGRWLYQALNNRVSFRVEARFERSTSSSIELTRRTE